MNQKFETLSLMDQVAAEKLDGVEVAVIDDWGNVTHQPESLILGSCQWMSLNGRRRLIHKDYVSYGNGYVCTSPDRARHYLIAKGWTRKRKRISGGAAAEFASRRVAPPQYAQPGKVRDAVYLDLKSAYWQILTKVGWDVEYRPGMYLGVGPSVADFPFEHDRLARNSLVSLCKSAGTMMVWDAPHRQVVPLKSRGNVYHNPSLWTLVMDILNGIAEDMRAVALAYYVNMDGYIVSKSRLPEAQQVAADWGVHMVVKHAGRAVIRGLGDYDIGDRLSAMPRTIRGNDLIRAVHTDWLRNRVGRI